MPTLKEFAFLQQDFYFGVLDTGDGEKELRVRLIPKGGSAREYRIPVTESTFDHELEKILNFFVETCSDSGQQTACEVLQNQVPQDGQTQAGSSEYAPD